MFKKKSRLKIAQEKAENAINKTNERIDTLGAETQKIYDELTAIQELFDKIRNVPNEKRLQYEETKQIRLNWKQQAEKIEKDYKKAEHKNAGAGIAGAGVGVAVVAMGPTIAMGVATTFGVASTGTAIATLHGVAQVNAALAWLGGGALAAGGGGMAAGNAFLALAGPVGWAIAGVSIVSSGLLFWKNKKDRKRLEDVFTTISDRDVKRYNLAIVEINERITRITDEAQKLHKGIQRINSFGFDYNSMSEAQQYELGSYVNLMVSSTQLLTNPILGLQPKYTENDFKEFLKWEDRKSNTEMCKKHNNLIVSLTNFLYSIELDDKDKKLLWKALKNNKKWLKSMNENKRNFDLDIIDAVIEALKYKYPPKT